jgi:hypothetical protein
MHQSDSVLPGKLARGFRQFELWRGQQEKRGRLPDHLWSLAVELAREFGVSRTAKTLRLAYNTLKEKSQCSEKVNRPDPMPTLPFLELRPADRADAQVECTIECERSPGQILRIHLKGPHWSDLSSLCERLWGTDR